MPTLITLLDPATETTIKWKGGLVNSSKVGGRGGVGWGWRNNYTVIMYSHIYTHIGQRCGMLSGDIH